MTELTILGSGTPTPAPSRFGTSCVLTCDDAHLMFDCGPATTHKLVKAGMIPTQVDYLFFTHHHFDHNADYPCFLLSRWDQSTGKEKGLEIFGPKPTASLTEKLVGAEGAFEADWRARVGAPVSQHVHKNRGGSLPRPEPSYKANDIADGAVIERAGLKVTARSATHVEPWLDSLAYRVDTPKGAIAFAGDTEPCRGVAELAVGARVLVANCWDHQAVMEDNGEAAGQTGTVDAGRMATDAGVETLVLIHTGPRLCEPGSKEKAIADISQVFDGKIIFGEELMRIRLW